MFKSKLEFELIKSLTQKDEEPIKDTFKIKNLPAEQSNQPLVIGELQSEEADETSTTCMTCSHYMPHTNLCGKFIRKIDSPYEPLCNSASNKDSVSV